MFSYLSDGSYIKDEEIIITLTVFYMPGKLKNDEKGQ